MNINLHDIYLIGNMTAVILIMSRSSIKHLILQRQEQQKQKIDIYKRAYKDITNELKRCNKTGLEDLPDLVYTTTKDNAHRINYLIKLQDKIKKELGKDFNL